MMKNKDISIYIHIPFCNSKCYYCSFISGVYSAELKKEYFDSLKKELLSYKEKLLNYSVETIYIGGGTPSSVDATLIEEVIYLIKDNFNLKQDVEITIECNPNSTTLDKLKKYKQCGINRISFGIQSMSNKTLKLIGRNDTKQQAIQAINLAQISGFNNISCDLMLGLPNQKSSNVLRDAKFLIKHGIKHLSAYMLMLEDGTKLCSLVKDNIIKVATEEKSVKIYNKLHNKLKKYNFNRYEVSNFSLEGYESKHNLRYWQQKEYIGLGVAAHSFFDGKRFSNTENLKDYLNGTTTVSNEDLSFEELREEYIMLSLRCKNGIDLKYYKDNYGDLLKEKENEIRFLEDGNFIEIKDERLKICEDKFGVMNMIILKII